MRARIFGTLLLLCGIVGCGALRPMHFEGTAVLPAQAAPDFRLADEMGRPFTLGSVRGKTAVLFFGYTHCPDTCPTTLAKLVAAVRQAGALRSTAILFITVDPERDTPATLGRFVKRFDGPVVGLTGTRAQIDATERSYHVWAQRIPGKHGNDDYDDSHSASIYFIDRDGYERVIHEPDDAVASLAADIRTLTK